MKVNIKEVDKIQEYRFVDLSEGDAIVSEKSTRVKLNDHQFLIVWKSDKSISFYGAEDWNIYAGDKGILHKAEINLKLTR